MDRLGEAVERACGHADPAFLRVNLEILGNTDGFLHAHVWPRYAWEPADLVRLPVWLHPGTGGATTGTPSARGTTRCARRSRTHWTKARPLQDQQDQQDQEQQRARSEQHRGQVAEERAPQARHGEQRQPGGEPAP